MHTQQDQPEPSEPSKFKKFVKSHGRTALEVTGALAATVAIIGYREKAQAISDWYADTPKLINDLETFLSDKGLTDEFNETYLKKEF